MSDRYGRDEHEPRQLAHQASEPTDPVDLSLVQADDALLDTLSHSDQELADALADDELNALLLAWKRDVDTDEAGELIDTQTAVATVKAARARKRPRPRLMPVAAAAAILAVVFGGVGLAARDAQPGDTLWGLTKVLYAEHARSVEAAHAVRADLRDAQQAIKQGKLSDAQSALKDAAIALPKVSTQDGQADLRTQHEALLAQLPLPVVPPVSTTPPTTPTTPPTSTTPTTPPTTPTTSPTTPTTPTTTTSETPSSPSTESSSTPNSRTNDTTNGTNSGTQSENGGSPPAPAVAPNKVESGSDSSVAPTGAVPKP
ncbi:hypothetical protein EV193_106318 [Herbihabitans rhizosphaerae]|uniref:Anti-sigma-D factor RsdA sigma factor binding region domain-containing protein n=1 Tax=Herbihabitans rhizosphaerae TaxID=1872711 RepID=A0A4Q7KPA1_9PSEU|nr:anti-sigma-D factor RsdA [Herbihabitans rhizosphaerae]RZS37082.1 hypothetical protein EV193_106318 [Herbihabitans rhizosphaerae]